MSLQVHLIKCETIFSSKAPKSYINLITYINIENSFDPFTDIVIVISNKIGRSGTEAQNLVI